MKQPLTFLLSFVFLCAPGGRNGFAQMNPMWNSIYLRVAQSDTVVIGHVVSAGSPFGNESTNGRRQPFILAVDEILKGHPDKRLSLLAEHEALRDMDRAGLLCAGCTSNRTKLLVMLTHASGATRTDIVPLGTAVMDITARLEILTRPEDLIKEVRSEIKREPGVLDIHLITSWTTSPLLKGTYFKDFTIYTPVDDRTQDVAHRVLALCQSEPPSDDFAGAHCREAIEALRSFKSQENVRLLTQFIDNPYKVDTNKGDFYPIRFAARQILTSWGLEADITSLERRHTNR